MKYKHLKTGVIATKFEGTKYSDTIYHCEKFGFLNEELVENSCDWEKIADYEITEFYWTKNIGTVVDYTFKLEKNNMYSVENYYSNSSKSDAETLIRNGWDVYSVKRLPDGAEFKIGDVVNSIFEAKGQEEITIARIDLIDTIPPHIRLEGENSKIHSSIPLSKAVKVEPKKVLYTTEDGVDRYEYQSEWWIIKDSENNMWRFIANNNSIVRQGDVENGKIVPIWKVFSTKQAAEKWMEENNPKYIFTTDDGVNIYLGDQYWYVDKKIFHFYYSRANSTSGSSKEFYAYFSTEALAKKYIDDNTKFLLTEDGVKVPLKGKYYFVTISDTINEFTYNGNSTDNKRVFSTKEKAEEYILWNKPRLSLNDIVNTKVHGGHGFKMNPDQVIKLAKQKQKNEGNN